MRSRIFALLAAASLPAWADLGASPAAGGTGLLRGAADNGSSRYISVTPEGHMEVAIHDPIGPFGSLHSESWTPVFQADAVYGVNSGENISTTSTGGSSTASSSMFVVSTGTQAGGFGTVQSRKRLRYRPGQGVVGRFTAAFSSINTASTILVAGFGHAEDGVFVGVNGANGPGILYSHHGSREVRTLTVTVGAGGAENLAITLNDVAQPTCAVTSGTATATAYKISQCTFTGWKAEQIGATVLFVRDSAGVVAGAFTLANGGGGATTAGSFAQTKAGAAATDDWVYQSAWNGDKLNGNGSSGVTIDWTKLNVFEVQIQYLGAGAITVFAEVSPSNGNNSTWTRVHTIRLPNTLSQPSFGNPAFPFTAAAYSTGGTTDVNVKVGSYAGFIEGQHMVVGNRFSYIGTHATSTSALTPFITIRNARYYGGRTNQAVVNLLSASVACAGNNATAIGTLYVLKNATLSTGTPSFASFAVPSVTYTDTAATAVTYATNDQLVWSGSVPNGGAVTFAFSDVITIQPGETLTLASKSTTQTSTCVAQVNTREDQ